MFCNIPADHVISAPDVESIYDVPVNFERDNLGNVLCDILGISNGHTDLRAWKSFVGKVKREKAKHVNIAVVGKYFDSGDFVLSDVYISVLEALKISSHHAGAVLKIDCVNSKDFEGSNAKRSVEKLKKYDGILVPGGFGATGIEGKIAAIKFARENKIPYFGLCYGMQLMVIEYARHVANLKGAHTTEINPETHYPVIDIMAEQKKHMQEGKYGATMRLGAYPAYLKKGTVARNAYASEKISERHRHRYEVNNKYIPDLEAAGLVFSGTSPDDKLMEIAELPKSVHPFFLGTQFHPEFKARPLRPHPLFSAFVKAALNNQ